MANDWRLATVSDIAAPSRNALVGGPFGSNLLSSDYVHAGVPVIRGQNLATRWVSGPFAFVTDKKAHSLAANLARPGDIVFTQRGTLGQVSLIPERPFEHYLISQSQMKLTVNRNVADPLFVYYLFLSDEQQSYILRNAIQTGVPHTNLGILRTTPITVPPLADQHAIAFILGSLDDKIESNIRMNETLDAMARAIFKSWFVNFDGVSLRMDGRAGDDIPDVFPGSALEQSVLGLIPSGWNVSAIGDVVKIVGGSTPSTDNAIYWDAGDFAFATPKDLSKLSSPVLLHTERSITRAGVASISSGLLPVGTVLLSSRAPIGYVAVTETPVAVNQGFIAMVCEGPVPNHYVRMWTQQNMDAIEARANGTTFLEVSKSNFRSLPILVPPAQICSTFTQVVRPLHERVVTNLKESETLAVLRESLLPKLISGEIRVKQAEQQVEAVL
jgi:type I restriction enzyme S subunit